MQLGAGKLGPRPVLWVATYWAGINYDQSLVDVNCYYSRTMRILLQLSTHQSSQCIMLTMDRHADMLINGRSVMSEDSIKSITLTKEEKIVRFGMVDDLENKSNSLELLSSIRRLL